MKFLINTLISALLVATVAEVGKRSAFVGALLIALPVTSIIALSFLYVETKDAEKVAALSTGIFWLVLPTLLFFLLLPQLLRMGWGYWVALPAASLVMIGVFFGYALLLTRMGVKI